MPKMKTKKSVVKRFKRTATGKVMTSSTGKRHLLTHKSRKRKNNLRGMKTLSKSFTKKISLMLGPK